MIKKLVIPPKSDRAIAFFDDLTKRKEEIKKKLEKNTAITKMVTQKKG